jgi:hypothetical protein
MGIIGDPTDHSEDKEYHPFINRFVELRHFRDAVTQDMDETLARSTYIAGLMLGLKGLFMAASFLQYTIWIQLENVIWGIPIDEIHIYDSIGFPIFAFLLLVFAGKEIVKLHMHALGLFNKGFSWLINKYMMYKWKRDKQDSSAAQALARSQAKYMGFLYRFSPKIRDSFVKSMVWAWILYITLDHTNVAQWLTIVIYETMKV